MWNLEKLYVFERTLTKGMVTFTGQSSIHSQQLLLSFTLVMASQSPEIIGQSTFSLQPCNDMARFSILQQIGSV